MRIKYGLKGEEIAGVSATSRASFFPQEGRKVHRQACGPLAGVEQPKLRFSTLIPFPSPSPDPWLGRPGTVLWVATFLKAIWHNYPSPKPHNNLIGSY